ncbi:hypothetical protein [Streptomyces sp. NPDC092952]
MRSIDRGNSSATYKPAESRAPLMREYLRRAASSAAAYIEALA